MRRWHAGSYRALRGRGGARKPHRSCPGYHRPVLARGKRTAPLRHLTASFRAHVRRPFFIVAAAKPGADPFCRTDAGRRAAPCRHSGANRTSSDPLVDPTFFGAVPDARRSRDGAVQRVYETRGYETMLDAIRLLGSGAYVSDRRANSVRFDHRRTGRAKTSPACSAVIEPDRIRAPIRNICS